MGCIDIHVALNLWLKAHNGKFDLYETYYDPGRKKSGLGHTPRTTIWWQAGQGWKEGQLTADAISIFTLRDKKPRMICIELHKGRDAERLIRQVEVYVNAFKAAAIEKHHRYEMAARCLLVFDQLGTLERFQKKIIGQIEERTWNRFRVNDLDSVRENFNTNWRGLEPESPPAPLIVSA